MRIAYAIVLIPFASATWSQGEEQSEAAVVVCQKGTVLITRSGNERVEVRGAAPLRKGDRATAQPASSAVVYFADGRVRSLGEGQSLRISRRPGGKSALAAAFRALVARLRAGFAAGGASRALGTRGDDDQVPTIVSPRNTRILPDGVALKWEAVPDAQRYKVALLGPDGVSVLWQGLTEATKLDYPDDAPALSAGGTYRWEVAAQMPDGKAPASDLAWFAVLGTDRARQVRDAAGELSERLGEEAALPLAALYAEHELYALAIQVLEAECHAERAGPAAHLLLTDLYSTTSVIPAAQRALEAAEACLKDPERGLWAEGSEE
jgi:hypothetical protein